MDENGRDHLTRNINSRRFRDNHLENHRWEGQWINANIAMGGVDFDIVAGNGILSLG